MSDKIITAGEFQNLLYKWTWTASKKSPAYITSNIFITFEDNASSRNPARTVSIRAKQGGKIHNIPLQVVVDNKYDLVIHVQNLITKAEIDRENKTVARQKKVANELKDERIKAISILESTTL